MAETLTMADVGVLMQSVYLDNPAFCYFLSGIDRKIIYESDRALSQQIPMAAVGKSNSMSYRIYINSKGFTKLKDLERRHNVKGLRRDVLMHEGFHIAYLHVGMMRKVKYPEIFNIAADLEINQYCSAITSYNANNKIGQFTSKYKAILNDKSLSKEEKKEALRKFNEEQDPIFATIEAYGWGTEKHKGSNYYYQKLLQAANEFESKMNGGNKEDGEDGNSNSSGNNSTSDQDAVGEMIYNMKNNQDFSDAISELLGNGKWKEFLQDDDAQTVMDMKIKRALKKLKEDSKNTPGKLPGSLLDEIELALLEKPPVADWKRMLRVFTARAIVYYTKLSSRKLNKRHPDFKAIKIKNKIRIFVTTDTSGSMDADDLRESLTEVENIRKLTGAELDLGECDAELYVKEICKVGKSTIANKTTVTGRGGTSVEPAIEYVNNNMSLYTCFIYITDGWVPPPRELCKIPMITVITSDGISVDQVEEMNASGKFGLVIKTKSDYKNG